MDERHGEQPDRTSAADDCVDRRLAARFLSGEEPAFDEIVRRHQGRVSQLVHRLLNCPADVEDVVQDVFVAVLSKLHQYRGDSRFSTWLTRIAVNQCRSHHRRRSIRRRGFVRLFEKFRTADVVENQRWSSDSHDTVREAVGNLPAKYREPIVLRYFEQMALPEIADVLNLTRGAVEVRLTRGRQRLKTILGPEFDRESP